MVFPLGMYATASAEFGGAASLPFMVLVGAVAAYVALAAWVLVCVMWVADNVSALTSHLPNRSVASNK
jgi:tellurite resistance protein TehA-like permease